MDFEKLRQVRALNDQELRAAQRDGVLDSLMADHESADLLRILSLPELASENLELLPFEVRAWVKVRTCGQLMVCVDSHGIEFSGQSSRLRRSLALLPENWSRSVFPRCLEIRAAEEVGTFPLVSLRRASGKTTLEAESAGTAAGSEAIEIWEAGELTRKTTSQSQRQFPRFDLLPGRSAFVRTAGGEHGIEILAVEGEFSQQEFRSAVVSCCLTGDFELALQIVRSQFPDVSGFLSWGRLIERGLQSLHQVTRSEELILHPLPMVRSRTLDRDARTLGTSLVQRGIEDCWPELISDPPPGGEGDQAIQDERLLSFWAAYQRFVDGELSSESIFEQGQSQTGQQPDLIAEAWAGLIGWIHVMEGRYSAAAESFRLESASGEDRFQLRTGRTLARHLARFDQEIEEDEMIDSTLEFWKEFLLQSVPLSDPAHTREG